MSLFRFNSRKRAWRINKRNYRQAKLFGHAHQPNRFAISLGLRHTEVALNFILRVAPFLLRDDHDRFAVEIGRAANQSAVVAHLAVTVQLLKVFKNRVDVIERVRALRMTSDLNFLPGSEVAIDISLRGFDLALKA